MSKHYRVILVELAAMALENLVDGRADAYRRVWNSEAEAQRARVDYAVTAEKIIGHVAELVEEGTYLARAQRRFVTKQLIVDTVDSLLERLQHERFMCVGSMGSSRRFDDYMEKVTRHGVAARYLLDSEIGTEMPAMKVKEQAVPSHLRINNDVMVESEGFWRLGVIAGPVGTDGPATNTVLVDVPSSGDVIRYEIGKVFPFDATKVNTPVVSGDAENTVERFGAVVVPQFAWGRKPAFPVVCAWGSRAILELDPNSGRQRFYTLPDRCSMTGPAEATVALSRWLDKVGLPLLKDLLEQRRVDGRGREVIALERDGYRIEACPNGSSGYLYIGAWKELAGDRGAWMVKGNGHMEVHVSKCLAILSAMKIPNADGKVIDRDGNVAWQH